jgi:hypothetical protein
MTTELPKTHTPLSLRDLYNALGDEAATIDAQGEHTLLPRKSLLVLCAHVWHETGAGASCFNWSLAGIKWSPGCGCDFATMETFEYYDGSRVNLPQRFRAFATLEDGAANYLHTMRTTFGGCWPYVVAGDAAGFAFELYALHYFTAPAADYVAAMARRYAEVDAALPEADVLATVRDERSVTGPVKDG